VRLAKQRELYTLGSLLPRMAQTVKERRASRVDAIYTPMRIDRLACVAVDAPSFVKDALRWCGLYLTADWCRSA
jgi:hypothetical protein